jgi:hypothetical protein
MKRYVYILLGQVCVGLGALTVLFAVPNAKNDDGI